jgi:glyoxylate reductase
MSGPRKVLVTGESIGAEYLEELRDAGLLVVNPEKSFPPSKLDEQELADALDQCVAYIVGGDEWASKKALASAKYLKVVAFLGVGYESFVDADGARELGIPVTNTPGTYANSVAEFSIGMLLDRRRRICDYAEGFRTGNELVQEKRSDLHGHPVGIVGMGHIGQRLAEILRGGFQADVHYFNRSRKPVLESELGIKYCDLGQLVNAVESLMIMVPENSSTIGMINDGVLSARDASMPGLHIIDTARPEVIDPLSLLAGLDSGRVESVAFDGFYREDNSHTAALRAHSQVLVTPHIASLTHDARDAMSRMCVDTVLNIVGGRPDRHVVNGVAS